MSGESWPLYGSNLEEVERELKDKLILDGNEIHPLKTSHLNRFGPSGPLHWTRGILERQGAITHMRFIINVRRIGALTGRGEQSEMSELMAFSASHIKFAPIKQTATKMWNRCSAKYVFIFARVFCLIVCLVSRVCCSFCVSYFRFQLDVIQTISASPSGKLEPRTG